MKREAVDLTALDRMLRLLAVLGVASGLRLITRNMIRTPEDQPLPVEYEPVPLRTKETTEEPQQFMARSLDVTDVPTSVDQDTTTATYEDEETATAIPADQQVAARRKTTILHPVAGLWRNRQLLDPDIWGILRTAYYCLFSGLDCFSSRVFPLVKSFIGYQPHYPYPRSIQLGGGNQVMTGLMKELLLGLVLVSLPWVGGMGIATGRALASGILGLAANGTNYYM